MERKSLQELARQYAPTQDDSGHDTPDRRTDVQNRRPARAPLSGEPDEHRERQRHSQHADDRPRSEGRKVRDARRGIRRRGYEERRNRSAARQAMRNPEAERAPPVYRGVAMAMARISGMTVKVKVRAGGNVGMRVHVPAPAHVAPNHRRPQEDQQCGDEQLRRRPEPVGQLDVERDDQQRHGSHRHRMPDAPDQAEAGGAPQPPPAGPGRKRRHGSEMVGLEGVPQTEKAAYGDNGYN